MVAPRRPEPMRCCTAAAPDLQNPAGISANVPGYPGQTGLARPKLRREVNFMDDATSQTVYFFNRHPISCEIILAKLRAGRGHLDDLRPEDLFPHDQDHYGGVAATDELARGAQIGSR